MLIRKNAEYGKTTHIDCFKVFYGTGKVGQTIIEKS